MFHQEVIYGNDNLELSVSRVKLSSTHNAMSQQHFTCSTSEPDYYEQEATSSFIRRRNVTVNFNSVRRNSFFACTNTAQSYSQSIKNFDSGRFLPLLLLVLWRDFHSKKKPYLQMK
jgi:hypothetical protein